VKLILSKEKNGEAYPEETIYPNLAFFFHKLDLIQRFQVNFKFLIQLFMIFAHFRYQQRKSIFENQLRRLPFLVFHLIPKLTRVQKTRVHLNKRIYVFV
jgi:hypothetical protein